MAKASHPIAVDPDGLEVALLERASQLDSGLEDQHQFTSLAFDVAQGRLPIDSLVATLVPTQRDPTTKLRAIELCHWFVAEIATVIAVVREGANAKGELYLDHWSPQGDLYLMHYP